MKKVRFALTLLFTIPFFFTACIKQTEYDVTAINQTDFNLDKVFIGFNHQGTSLEPRGHITISAQASTGSMLGEPFFSVSVNSYSDSTGTHEGRNSISVSPNLLDKKTKNIVKISLNQESQHPNDFFLITVNE